MASIKQWMEQNPNQLPTGFVSPNGDFYFANFLEHCAMASEICEWFGYETSYVGRREDPLSVLEDKGWIHITGATYFEHGLQILYTTRFFTEEQKNCLLPIIENPPRPLTKGTIFRLKYQFPDINWEKK